MKQETKQALLQEAADAYGSREIAETILASAEEVPPAAAQRIRRAVQQEIRRTARFRRMARCGGSIAAVFMVAVAAALLMPRLLRIDERIRSGETNAEAAPTDVLECSVSLDDFGSAADENAESGQDSVHFSAESVYAEPDTAPEYVSDTPPSIFDTQPNAPDTVHPLDLGSADDSGADETVSPADTSAEMQILCALLGEDAVIEWLSTCCSGEADIEAAICRAFFVSRDVFVEKMRELMLSVSEERLTELFPEAEETLALL